MAWDDSSPTKEDEHLFNRITTLLLAGAITMTMAGAAQAQEVRDVDANATVDVGTLTFTAVTGTFNFNIMAADVPTGAVDAPTLTWQDSRAAQTGYNITMIATDFAGQGAIADQNIPAGDFAVLGSVGVVAPVGGNLNPAPTATDFGAAAELATAQKIVSANQVATPDQGKGEWTLPLDANAFGLTVAPGKKSGAYKSKVTFSLNVGP